MFHGPSILLVQQNKQCYLLNICVQLICVTFYLLFKFKKMSTICSTKFENSNISCRICLKTFSSYYEFGTLMNVHEHDGPTFADAILDFSSNMDCFKAIDKNTVYLICPICAEELKTAYKFLQKVRNAGKLLQNSQIVDQFVGNGMEFLTMENSPLEALNIEHEEVIGLDIKDTLEFESMDDSFKFFIEEESNFSFDDEEKEIATSIESLGLQLHCSPCNKTFESQESMNTHKTWHLTNDLNISGGVVNEVIINPPDDCEQESNEQGNIFF